jgi:hypothetical protein
MRGLVDEYRRSLKMLAAEEVFDLVFYRPVAYLFVKGMYRLPITPNQVSIISLAAGLIAAWQIAIGDFVVGGIWYVAANVLDCADGQLARLQNSGTLLGRVVDGVVDYVSGIVIFVGVGIGLASVGNPHWFLVVVAGVSTAIHALFFDHYQSEYVSIVRGEPRFLDREIEQFTQHLHRLSAQRTDRVRQFFLVLYIRYLRLQQRFSVNKSVNQYSSAEYERYNRAMIRFWSLLGPTTNRTLLIVCVLFVHVDLYLWIVATAGNLWLIACYVLQRRIYRLLSANRSTNEVESVHQ